MASRRRPAAAQQAEKDLAQSFETWQSHSFDLRKMRERPCSVPAFPWTQYLRRVERDQSCPAAVTPWLRGSVLRAPPWEPSAHRA